MPTTSKPWCSHSIAIRPGSEPLQANRRPVSCGLLLLNATLAFRRVRSPRSVGACIAWLSERITSSSTLALTSTIVSNSTKFASSQSLRCTRTSWLNTISPLAALSRGVMHAWPLRCLLNKRMPEASVLLRLSDSSKVMALGNCERGSASQEYPGGLCNKIVVGSVGSKVAFLSSSILSSVTRCCGLSWTLPFTRTQPPSMYCSAWLREQLICSASRFASRIPAFEGVFIEKRSHSCRQFNGTLTTNFQSASSMCLKPFKYTSMGA